MASKRQVFRAEEPPGSFAPWLSRYRFSCCVFHKMELTRSSGSSSSSSSGNRAKSTDRCRSSSANNKTTNDDDGSPLPVPAAAAAAASGASSIIQEAGDVVVQRAAAAPPRPLGPRKLLAKSISAPLPEQVLLLPSPPAAAGGSSSANSSPRGGGKPKKQLARLISWSRYLQPGDDERAVEEAEEWMLDLSKLLLGHRFATGAHSRLYHGIYAGQAVAVKVTRHEHSSGSSSDDCMTSMSSSDKLFTQEVSILSGLQHPNVVQLVGACKKPGVCCVVVTRYLGGGSLREVVRRRGPLAVEEVVRLAADVARGGAYLHSRGVVHRDLKSDNLLLDGQGVVKITDFGVAKHEAHCGGGGGDGGGAASAAAALSDTGTYRWMAPEMVARKPHDRKVDVYSYGLVLWELVTGEVPFHHMSPVQAAYAVVNKHARPLIPEGCAPVLAQLMQRCWSSRPEHRPEFSDIVQCLT